MTFILKSDFESLMLQRVPDMLALPLKDVGPNVHLTFFFLSMVSLNLLNKDNHHSVCDK